MRRASPSAEAPGRGGARRRGIVPQPRRDYWQGPGLHRTDPRQHERNLLNGRRVDTRRCRMVTSCAWVTWGVVARVAPKRDRKRRIWTCWRRTCLGPGLARELAAAEASGPSNLPVLMVGETGAGKEHAAHAVHLLSGRHGPFHAVNCAALPDRAGRGGAVWARAGRLHRRGAGPPRPYPRRRPRHVVPRRVRTCRCRCRPNCCGCFQDGQVTPLGETRPYAVDVRVVAACQRSAEQLVTGGRARQDLMARLSGVTIAVPPLRERRADIAVLFRHLLRVHGGVRAPEIDPRMLECMLLDDWPGNVPRAGPADPATAGAARGAAALRRSFLPAAMIAKPAAVRAAGRPAVANDGACRRLRW